MSEETGPFNKPDATTKDALFAEERDTINRISAERDRAQKNNKWMAAAVCASMIVTAISVMNADTKYMMVDRDAEGRRTIYVPDEEYIPLNQTIEAELAYFVRNSRRITNDLSANLEMRWDALKMVNMPNQERKRLFDEAKKILEDINEKTVVVTDIETISRGAKHWTLTWVETVIDDRTGSMASVKQFADVQVFYLEQEEDNPAGIMFSRPIESIRHEVVETPKQVSGARR